MGFEDAPPVGQYAGRPRAFLTPGGDRVQAAGNEPGVEVRGPGSDGFGLVDGHVQGKGRGGGGGGGGNDYDHEPVAVAGGRPRGGGRVGDSFREGNAVVYITGEQGMEIESYDVLTAEELEELEPVPRR